VEDGLAILQGAVAHYPEEFTFHYALALNLKKMERYGEALPHAEAAARYGYGDNALRAALLRAQILHARGDGAAPAAVVEAALAGAARPEAALAVKTGRYLDQLEALSEEISGGSPR